MQPSFIQQPQVMQPRQPQMQPQSRQQTSRGRGDIYLPPMPEMLNASAPANPNRRPLNDNNPPTVIRGHIDDSPARGEVVSTPPIKLTMPSAEELGLNRGLNPHAPAVPPPAAASVSAVDWNALRGHLDSLGAAYYRLEKLPDGNYCFLCALPYAGDRAKQRHFEARATNEREAVHAVFGEIARWQQGR
jgi:hypothetical protein